MLWKSLKAALVKVAMGVATQVMVAPTVAAQAMAQSGSYYCGSHNGDSGYGGSNRVAALATGICPYIITTLILDTHTMADSASNLTLPSCLSHTQGPPTPINSRSHHV